MTAQGEARSNAARVNGAVLTAARQGKAAKYWELLESARCQLVVVGIETGGHWSEESMGFIETLAGDGGARSFSCVEAICVSCVAAKMVSDDCHLLQQGICMVSGGFPSA